MTEAISLRLVIGVSGVITPVSVIENGPDCFVVAGSMGGICVAVIAVMLKGIGVLGYLRVGGRLLGDKN